MKRKKLGTLLLTTSYNLIKVFYLITIKDNPRFTILRLQRSHIKCFVNKINRFCFANLYHKFSL